MARDRHKIKFQISDTIVNITGDIAQYQDLPVQTVQVNSWRVGLIWLSIDAFIEEPINLVDFGGEPLQSVLLTVPEVQYQKTLAIASSLNFKASEVHQICLCRGVEILRRVTAVEQKIAELG